MGNEIPRNSKPLRKKHHRRKKPIGALPSPQAVPRREGANFDVLTTVLQVLYILCFDFLPFPSSRCASTTKMVLPSESIVATEPQVQPSLLSLSAIFFQSRIWHDEIAKCANSFRSEERRVGKECRYWWSQHQ